MSHRKSLKYTDKALDTSEKDDWEAVWLIYCDKHPVRSDYTEVCPILRPVSRLENRLDADNTWQERWTLWNYVTLAAFS